MKGIFDDKIDFSKIDMSKIDSDLFYLYSILVQLQEEHETMPAVAVECGLRSISRRVYALMQNKNSAWVKTRINSSLFWVKQASRTLPTSLLLRARAIF